MYCIDPWANYTSQEDFHCVEQSRIADDRKIIDSFMRNTAFLGDSIKMMRGFSTDFSGMIAGQNFDLIFIDGAHDYDSVKCDILMCLAALKPGGLLTGHDFHSMGHGVRQAVNELISLAPSITVKGVIDNTYIWFARVEQPAYELALHEVTELYRSGDVSGALHKAYAAWTCFKTEEVFTLISTLKSQLTR